MPRARLLKPGFFANEELAALPMSARLLFQGLWILADRAGRLKDIPKWIDAQIFPYDSVKTASILQKLHDAHFIERYTSEDGQRLIWIPSWSRHQHPHPNEPESILPPHARDIAVSSSLPSNDNVTSEQLQSHEPSPPLSRANPALPSESPPSIPSEAKAESESLTAAQRNGHKAPARDHPLNFTESEWRRIFATFPGINPQTRWHEWVLWIEEEEERRPKNKVTAFEGWLKKRSA